MKFKRWANSRIRRFDVWDIQLIKLSVFAFTLMLAKLWEPLLVLDWYWYGLLVVLFGIRPIWTFWKR